MLTADEILKRLESGEIEIDPFDLSCLNPNSYNLTLHEEIIIYNAGSHYFDMAQVMPKGVTRTIPNYGLVIMPGDFILARTNEFTRTHTLVPTIEGRSSIARLGIMVHQTAGYGDIGFCGYWTLEISCQIPVKIYPNIEICQIGYALPVGEITKTYQGKYQNNCGIGTSRLHVEFE